jgi:light-regulated signal transduction histidine kinase (bacteriophytochrome)
VRPICKAFSDIISKYVNVIETRQSRNVLGEIVMATALGSAYIAHSHKFSINEAPMMLRLFQAGTQDFPIMSDNGIAMLNGVFNILGNSSDNEYEELLLISKYFSSQRYNCITYSNNMLIQSPDLCSLKIYRGFLFVPLARYESCYIAFLRKERIKVPALNSRKKMSWSQSPHDILYKDIEA